MISRLIPQHLSRIHAHNLSVVHAELISSYYNYSFSTMKSQINKFMPLCTWCRKMMLEENDIREGKLLLRNCAEDNLNDIFKNTYDLA
jgi:hypothetical protein